jgi:hypothetical protein
MEQPNPRLLATSTQLAPLANQATSGDPNGRTTLFPMLVSQLCNERMPILAKKIGGELGSVIADSGTRGYPALDQFLEFWSRM